MTETKHGIQTKQQPRCRIYRRKHEGIQFLDNYLV